MGLKGVLRRKLENRDTWEERQAKKLQKLRSERIKEESRAKLRALEEKERGRINKARSVGRPKPGESRVGKIVAGLDKGMQAYGESYQRMNGPAPNPRTHSKKKKPFDPLDSSTW